MSRFTIPEKVDWAGPEQTHEGTAVNSGPVHPNRRTRSRFKTLRNLEALPHDMEVTFL